MFKPIAVSVWRKLCDLRSKCSPIRFPGPVSCSWWIWLSFRCWHPSRGFRCKIPLISSSLKTAAGYETKAPMKALRSNMSGGPSLPLPDLRVGGSAFSLRSLSPRLSPTADVGWEHCEAFALSWREVGDWAFILLRARLKGSQIERCGLDPTVQRSQEVQRPLPAPWRGTKMWVSLVIRGVIW